MSPHTLKPILFAAFAILAWAYLNVFFVGVPLSLELIYISGLVAGVACVVSLAMPLRWFAKRSIVGWVMGISAALAVTVVTIIIAGSVAWIALGETTGDAVPAVVFSILIVLATPFALVWIAIATAIWYHFSKPST